jgi:hypothetical protein
MPGWPRRQSRTAYESAWRRRRTQSAQATYFFILTRLASTLPFVCLVPFSSTVSPRFSALQDVSSNLVFAFVLTLVDPMLNAIDGQVPVMGWGDRALHLGLVLVFVLVIILVVFLARQDRFVDTDL